MMMSMEMKMETPKSSSNNKTCVNCCAPLCHSNIHHDDHNNIEPSFSQILSSSFNPTNNGTKYLYSIFKLNYLKAFEALDWEVEEDENEVEQLILLCTNCNDVLTNLYQLYEDFLQLGKRESSLSKKLTRLDEIIDFQAQKTINCDLNPTSLSTYESSNNNLVDSFSSKSVPTLFTEKQSSSLNSQPTLRQPVVVLTRLPESSLKLRTTTTADDDDGDYNSPSPANTDDDDDYNPGSPLARMEVDGHEEIGILSEANSEEDETRTKSSSSRSGKKYGKSPARFRDKTKIMKMGSSTKSIMKSKLTANIKKKNNSIVRCKRNEKYVKKFTSTDINKKRNNRILGCKTNDKYILIKSKFPNPCWYCDRTDFATPADCLQHTKKEHLPKVDNSDGQSIRVCERCSKICGHGYPGHLKKCLLIPSGSVMDGKLQCTLCSYNCVRTNDLKAHMVAHATDRPHACDLCDFTAKTHRVLNNHKKYVHSNVGKERVKCDQCDRYYKNIQSLEGHKLSMHTADGYRKYREREEIYSARRREATQQRTLTTFCQDCNIGLMSRLGYCNHRRTVHGDSMGSEFTCDTCGKTFTQKRSLVTHTKIVHSDARPYLCDTCGKSFKSSFTVKQHFELTHTEEGRLKYNAKTRERNRMKRILAHQLKNAGATMGQ